MQYVEVFEVRTPLKEGISATEDSVGQVIITQSWTDQTKFGNGVPLKRL